MSDDINERLTAEEARLRTSDLLPDLASTLGELFSAVHGRPPESPPELGGWVERIGREIATLTHVESDEVDEGGESGA